MPGGRAKIPHALWPKKIQNKTENRNNIVTNSINNLIGPD